MSEECRWKKKTRSSCTIGPVLTAGLCSSENPIKAGTFPLCCCFGPRLLQRWSVSHSELDSDSFVWLLEVLIMFWTGLKSISFNRCLSNTCFPLTMTIHEFLLYLYVALSHWLAALLICFILHFVWVLLVCWLDECCVKVKSCLIGKVKRRSSTL